MKKDRLIYKALVEIANRMTAGHVNPFPRIASAIAQKEGRRKPVKPSTPRAIIYGLISLLAVATVAYAYNRFQLDSGLQAVDKAGLVNHFHQTAQPTLITSLPTQPEIPNGLSQSQNGITVALEWAYADSSRVDFALIVDGLNLPEGAQVGDYVCAPYVYTQEHIALIQPGIDTFQNQGGIIGQSQLRGAPIELTYEYQPSANISAYQKINISLDLTIGPCGPQWSVPNEIDFTGPWTGQTVTPPPLIGNYHLSFQVPISKGILLTPNQTIVHDNVSFRLEALILDPSYTQFQLCYQILDPEEILDESPRNTTITLQVDNQPPVEPEGLTQGEELDRRGCLSWGAPIPNITLPNRVTIRVSNWWVDKSGQPIDIAGPWEFTVDVTK